MSRLTPRQLAWIEIVLGVLPPTIVWALFVPAMLVIIAKFQSTASTTALAILLIGGGAGLFALWSRLLPIALGKERTSAATAGWRVAAIAGGLLASAVCLIAAFGQRDNVHGPGPWLIALVALAPAAVAVRLLLRRA